VREPAHPLESTGRSLTRADGEGKQLGDGGELREHALLAHVRNVAEPLVPRDDSRSGEAQHEEDDGKRWCVAGYDGERSEDDPGEAADRAPDHLFGPEPFDVGWLTGSLEPSPDRRGAAEHPLDPGSEIGQHGPEDA